LREVEIQVVEACAVGEFLAAFEDNTVSGVATFTLGVWS
jgi:hypothetical protein